MVFQEKLANVLLLKYFFIRADKSNKETLNQNGKYYNKDKEAKKYLLSSCQNSL